MSRLVSRINGDAIARGGAKIVGKYRETKKLTAGLETITGQRHSAAVEKLPS